MKIVMIYGNPIGDFYGGITTHVDYLTKNLSKIEEIDLTVLTFGEKNSEYYKDGIEFIELKQMRFGKLLYPFEIFYDIFRLEQIIKQINPDLIHIQGTSPNFSLFGMYMKKKYPLLITVHGYFAEEYKVHTGFRKIIYRLFCSPIEKKALSKITNIIVLSNQLKKIIEKITNSRVFTIPNGIDLDYIETVKSYEKRDHPTVFFLGYLTKGKGVDDLIKAIKLVKNKHKDVKLYIGGSGDYMDNLKETVKNLNLNENVTFLGLLNEKEKFAYMKSMDIFVLPSYWESSPFVLLEAMACGKPIITTNVGGNPSAVTDKLNGFLVKPGEIQKIADHIIYLLDHRELLDKMGQVSRKKSNDFKWENISQKTKDAYKEIISEKN